MKTCTKNRFPFSMRTRILTMLFVFILHSPAEDVNSVPAVLRQGSMAIEPVSRSVSQATCINNAVLWLVQQQRADGRWPGDDLSSTALSVLAVSIGSGPGWGVNPVFEKSVLSGYRALLGSLRSDGSPAIVSDDGIDDPISVLALCQISGLFPAEEDASIILAAVDRIASEQSADGTWGGRMPMIVRCPPKWKPIQTGAHWLWLRRTHTGWTRRLSRSRWTECPHRRSDAACPRLTPNRHSFPATWPDSASINRFLDFVGTFAASVRPKKSYHKDTGRTTVSFMT